MCVWGGGGRGSGGGVTGVLIMVIYKDETVVGKLKLDKIFHEFYQFGEWDFKCLHCSMGGINF